MSSRSEKTIEALLQALEGAVLVCDAAGRVLRADATASEWFGDEVEPDGSILNVLAYGDARAWFELASGSQRAALPFSSMVATTGGRWVEATLHPAGDNVVLQLKPDPSWTDAAPVPHEVLRDLIETMREPLASVRAAAETMALYPSMDAAATTQFMRIIENQTTVLSDRLDAAEDAYASLYRRAGPLQPIDASEFATALAHHLDGQLAIEVSTQRAEGGDINARLLVDAQAVTEALTFLANRIENAARCTALRVSVERVRSLAALDLIWKGGAVTSSRIREWEESTISWGDSIIKMTLAEILDHHDAQMIIRTEHSNNSVRLLLPVLNDTLEQ